MMSSYGLKKSAGWSHAVLQAIDGLRSTLRLSLKARDTCITHRQGRCPERNSPFFCADCTWAEGSSRSGQQD